jgi:hypothetical protein
MDVLAQYVQPSNNINLKIGCTLPFKINEKSLFEERVLKWERERFVKVTRRLYTKVTVTRHVNSIIKVRFRHSPIVFIFFGHTHCNVCGLTISPIQERNEEEDFEYKLGSIIHVLERLFGLHRQRQRRIYRNAVTIDNICSGGQFRHPISLCWNEYAHTVQNTMKGQPIVRYDRERFQGIHFRFSDLGTLVLYTGGRYRIWGCKNFESLKNILFIFNHSCCLMFGSLYDQLTSFK